MNKFCPTCIQEDISKRGYLDNSPYRNRPFNVINSNNITMNGVSKPLIGVSNLGEVKVMPPNSGEHNFRGSQVTEFPLRKYQSAGAFIGPPEYLYNLDLFKNDIKPDLYKEAVGLGQRQESKVNMPENMLMRQGESFSDFQKRNKGLFDYQKKEKEKEKNSTNFVNPLLAINYGLRDISERVERNRQDQYAREQFADSEFNPSFSHAENDYGTSPTRYLGYQSGGMFVSNIEKKVDRRGYPIPTRAQIKADPEFYGPPQKGLGLLNKYTSVYADGTGQPEVHSQYGKLTNTLEYMKNNIWTESNVSRPENMHIAANYDQIKKQRELPIAQEGGEFNYENEFDDFNFLFGDDEKINPKEEIKQKEVISKRDLRRQANDQIASDLMSQGFTFKNNRQSNTNYYQGNGEASTNISKNSIDMGIQLRNHAMNLGLSKEEASGLIGNAFAESNFNPTVVGKADNKGSQSIFQHHSERLNALKKFAASQGKDWQDPFVQTEFAVYELNSSHKSARGGNTATDAAINIMNKFERPAEWAKKQSVNQRVGFANKLMQYQKGGEYDMNQEEINELIRKGYKFDII